MVLNVCIHSLSFLSLPRAFLPCERGGLTPCVSVLEGGFAEAAKSVDVDCSKPAVGKLFELLLFVRPPKIPKELSLVETCPVCKGRSRKTTSVFSSSWIISGWKHDFENTLDSLRLVLDDVNNRKLRTTIGICFAR